jgi:hypothetical protein
MAGLLDFAARFGTEERCIEHLAGLRWLGGFVCSGCRGRVAWRLKARPRVYECGTCHRQEVNNGLPPSTCRRGWGSSSGSVCSRKRGGFWDRSSFPSGRARIGLLGASLDAVSTARS